MSNVTGQALPAQASALYRRIWRWHFYAGLVCLPVIVLLATTGALYLFRVEIEAVVYRHELENAGHGAATLAASEAIRRAEATGGAPIAYSPPARPGASAMVLMQHADGERRQVFVDTSTGTVLGSIAERYRLMPLLRSLHSLSFFGKAAGFIVEIVAGWVIVLVTTGVYLWWPRRQSGGVVTVRQTPRQRIWWRDLHAVTGAFAAVVIAFLALTGMPWSAFWGERFNQAMTDAGLGVPAAFWNEVPQSEAPLSSLGSVPWTVHEHPMPLSATPPAAHAAGGIDVDQAVSRLAALGLTGGYQLNLPIGPRGVYSAVYLPDHVRDQRVVHLDRYSGRVLADIDYSHYGAVGKVTEWGVSVHMGREFGRANQLVLLAGCLALLAVAASGVVMWWKRRPRGLLAAPPRRDADRIGRNVAVMAIVLGAVFPLLGLSMLVALVIDVLVPSLWRGHWAL
ncbi:MAG TPA: PepSY domain-containing protein [Caldimonas sp.]|nr:PepSY domain-containing protein [Caldimonas sp.]